MRLGTPNSALFSLFCLFSLITSLPLSPRNIFHLEALVRRATYSVVPVDGGAAETAGGNGSPTASIIISTIVQTQTAAPETIIQTDKITVSPATDVVISTKTVDSEHTQTQVVTVPSPTTTTVTAIGYSIVNANSPTVTVEVPVPILSSSTTDSKSPTSTSANLATAAPSAPKPLLSESTSQITSHTSTSQTANASSISTSSATRSPSSAASQTNSVGSSAQSTAVIPTSTSSTYDSGSWHTTYPTWSNSTRTTTEAAQASPTVSISGLYPNAPVAVPRNSIRAPVFDAVTAEVNGPLLKPITAVVKSIVPSGIMQWRDSSSKMTPEEKLSRSSDPFYL